MLKLPLLKVNADAQLAQELARKLMSLTEGELNTQIVFALGKTRLQKLQSTTQSTGVDIHLAKALVLAYEAPDKAAAIISAMENQGE